LGVVLARIGEEGAAILLPGGAAIQLVGQFEGDDREAAVDAGPGAQAAGGGVADVVLDGVTVVGGHESREVRGGAVVVVARLGHGVDGDHARGLDFLEGFEDGEGFGLGGGLVAAEGPGALAGFLPVGGGEVAVEIDEVLVRSEVARQAVGVGDGEDGDALAVDEMRLGAEEVEEVLGDGGAGRFAAVDGPQDESEGRGGVATQNMQCQGTKFDGVT
jgi:hypothetical protein